MKHLAYFLFVVAFFIFLISLATYFYEPILQEERYYASVNITLGTGGFDLNDSALTFGKVPFDGTVSRPISFRNDFSSDVILEIEAEGEIGKFLSFEKKRIISEGETTSILISVDKSSVEDVGFYEGEVIFLVKPV